jgi:hypothetical protein
VDPACRAEDRVHNRHGRNLPIPSACVRKIRNSSAKPPKSNSRRARACNPAPPRPGWPSAGLKSHAADIRDTLQIDHKCAMAGFQKRGQSITKCLGDVVLSSRPCASTTMTMREFPSGVAYIPKPWQPLNLLVAAEEALASLH